MPARRSDSPRKSTPGETGPRRSGNGGSSILEWGAITLVSLALCWLFWWPLWMGGGLIGGDLYPYYFPQKAFLADSLRSGTIPLWNPRVGFGYPVLGESQTGALYPPNLLLYSLFDVNTAYSISQLAHYLVALIAAYAVCRRLNLGRAGSLLASLVMIYGWFPARICLEWAIIGGAWFFLILWGAIAWLQTRRPKWLVLIAVAFGVDLLAGHYNLAFITLLSLLPLPLLVDGLNQEDASDLAEVDSVTSNGGKHVSRQTAFLAGGLLIACAIGFLIAAVQLLPTWELKSFSQRESGGDAFSPTYGYLPPKAISQLWMPWAWYAGDKPMDQMLGGGWLDLPSGTNQAESQLYLGLLPLLLAVLGVIAGPIRRAMPLRHVLGWWLFAAVSLFLATGWPIYWLSDLPGFGFFRGPGRYSLGFVLAFGLLAGAAFDALLRCRGWRTGPAMVVITLVCGVTVADLWAASRQYQFGVAPFWGRQVFYATLLDTPPLDFLEESALKRYFAAQGDQVRLYAPGQNIPTLLGVSALPVYLGLGPEIYESDALRIDFAKVREEEIPEIADRLRGFGVTHLLLEQRLDLDQWPVNSLGDWTDAFLNRALARREPYYLYELQDTPGRASLASGRSVTALQIEPHRATMAVDALPGDRLILRDLAYPGWELEDASLGAAVPTGPYRVCQFAEAASPPQSITWVYRPWSVFCGGVLSLLGLLAAGVLPWGWSRMTRPR